MDTEGLFAPATAAEAETQYEAVGPAAQVAVREVATALEIDPETYEQRVDANVVLTAREAIFASLLSVHVGTRAEFDEWREGRDRAVTELGSEHVSGVAWHDAPLTDEVLAATYENEPEAAVATLRRQAFARIYGEVVS